MVVHEDRDGPEDFTEADLSDLLQCFNGIKA